jgi:hypothetical protein
MDNFSIRFTFEGNEYHAMVNLVPDVRSSTSFPEYHVHLEDNALISRFSNDRVFIYNYGYFTCSYLPVPDDEIFMHTILDALTDHLNQPETFG